MRHKPWDADTVDNDKWKYICEVRSMSEETGHSVLLQAKIGVNDRSIVFNIPYIKEIIPVGILFKLFIPEVILILQQFNCPYQ